MNFKGPIQILIESRLTDAVDRYAQQFVDKYKISYDKAVNTINRLAQEDPSGNHKYLDWMIKHIFDSSDFIQQTQQVIRVVKKFHENLGKINEKAIKSAQEGTIEKMPETIFKAPKNIESYPDVIWLDIVASNAQHNLSKKQLRDVVRNETDKLYEDGELLIVTPRSNRSSCYYGAGTKWCVTSKRTSSYWDRYTATGFLIFILNKTNNDRKAAVHIKHDGDVSFWDIRDNNIKVSDAFKIKYNDGSLFIPFKAQEFFKKLFLSDFTKYKKTFLYLFGAETTLRELLDRGLDPIDIYDNLDTTIALINTGFPALFPEDGYKRMFEYYLSKGLPPEQNMSVKEIKDAFSDMGKGIKDVFNYYNQTYKENPEHSRYNPLRIMSHEDLVEVFGGHIPFIKYLLDPDSPDYSEFGLTDWYSIDDLLEMFDDDFVNFVAFLEDNDAMDFLDEMTELQQYKIYYKLYKSTEDPEKKKQYWNKIYEVIPKSDVRFNGDGSVTLEVDGWIDFVNLFAEGGRDINYRYVANNVLGDGLDWEPYSDIVLDWYNEVWDATDDENIQYIRKRINEKIDKGDKIEIWVSPWGDEDEYEEWIQADGEDGMFYLTKERLAEIGDNDLGTIIQHTDEFEDWKNEMTWAFENGYNAATLNNYWVAYHQAILDIIGAKESKWHNTGRYKHYKSGDNEYKNEIIELHFPNIDYWPVVNAYVKCESSYAEVFEYSSYLKLLEDILTNCDYEGGLLAPHVNEWPNHDDVEKYYNEDLPGRF